MKICPGLYSYYIVRVFSCSGGCIFLADYQMPFSLYLTVCLYCTWSYHVLQVQAHLQTSQRQNHHNTEPYFLLNLSLVTVDPVGRWVILPLWYSVLSQNYCTVDEWFTCLIFHSSWLKASERILGRRDESKCNLKYWHRELRIYLSLEIATLHLIKSPWTAITVFLIVSIGILWSTTNLSLNLH